MNESRDVRHVPPAGAGRRLGGRTGDELLARWPAARPFLLVGITAIVAGGLVAAASRPMNFGAGPWVAAYLVLVVGVAQIALGAGQAWLTSEAPSARWKRAELITWNLGAATTIVGTLVGGPILTSVGGIATLWALILFLRGVRPAGPDLWWVLYRGLAGFLAVSVLVGLALAWTRHR